MGKLIVIPFDGWMISDVKSEGEVPLVETEEESEEDEKREETHPRARVWEDRGG